MCDWCHVTSEPTPKEVVTLVPPCGCPVAICTSCFILLRGKNTWRGLMCPRCTVGFLIAQAVYI